MQIMVREMLIKDAEAVNLLSAQLVIPCILNKLLKILKLS